MNLLKGYQSPRITAELLECAMPITFDQYSKCSFNCFYCFSFFGAKGNFRACGREQTLMGKPLVGVDFKNFRKLFTSPNTSSLINLLITKKIPLHWGGLADPFCFNEKKYGLGLKILKLLVELQYPVGFSTKGNPFINSEYIDVFQKNPHLFQFQISCISLDENLPKKVEPGTPPPQERLKTIKTLNEMGIHTILRFRPYIHFYSEKTDEDLIIEAVKHGVRGISLEFLCLETRGESCKKRIDEMSERIGYDIWGYYKIHSLVKSGLMRLNPSLKFPILLRLKKLCKKLNIGFFVSDNHFKWMSDYGNCCGYKKDWTWSRGQFTEAQSCSRNHITFTPVEKWWGDNLDGYHYTMDKGGHIYIGNSRRKLFADTEVVEYFRRTFEDIKSRSGLLGSAGGTLILKEYMANGAPIFSVGEKWLKPFEEAGK